VRTGWTWPARLAAGLGAGVVIAASGTFAAPGAMPGASAVARPASAHLASAAAAQAASSPAVTVAVLGVTPSTPAVTSEAQPLTITVRLTNTTAAPLYDARLDAVREAPVTRPGVIFDLIAHPAAVQPTTDLTPHLLDKPLAARASTTVTFSTTTSDQATAENICLCNRGIYPINLIVRAATAPGGDAAEVGFGQTFVPSFPQRPDPVQVSWVLPLIDRPHRATASDVFVDDQLAGSVSPGGRLDRVLRVIEQVVSAQPAIRLTVLVDPELIDELTTMSNGYQVAAPGRAAVPGGGGAAARAWLDRLRRIAVAVDVALTPPADPDVDALSAAGLDWSPAAGESPDAASTEILGPAAGTDIAWPAGGTLSAQGLAAVRRHGASTVILNAAPNAAASDPKSTAEAPDAVTSTAGLTAVLLDNQLQGLAARALSGASGALPELVAALAVRAAQDPERRHYVALAADRYVNPQPAAAVRTIITTSTASWSTPLSIRQAVATVAPVAQPIASGGASTGLPVSLTSSLVAQLSFVDSLRAALAPADADKLLHGFAAAAQRCESSAWRAEPAGGARCGAELQTLTDGWRHAVWIEPPASGGYTLASSDAPLYLTVVNELPVAVTVRVSLSPRGGIAGLRADPTPKTRLAAGQRLPLRVSVHVTRTGHFSALAQVSTPDGATLGEPVTVNVRSTALGTVGLVITVAAGVVLAAAMARRLLRRLRARRAMKSAAR